LNGFYRENFDLVFEHGISQQDLMEMIPWERDVFVLMVVKRLQDREKEAKKHGK